MSDWEWRTLGDIASSQGYGLVDEPFGSNLPASCYVESGIPVIRGSNLTLGTDRFVANEFVYVSEETASQLERSLARPSDIVFTKKGTIGQTGLIPSSLPYDVYLISSNQMKLTVDESVADPIFVYYYVSSKESQNKIKKDSEFTGVPKTNTKYLREFPIYLPPLQQQKQISKTLDSLDRKIENLRRQNETLERIAQTLFKHWFVDFEFPFDFAQGKPNVDGKPYKSSGGAMEPSELGDIPAVWRVGKLGDEFDITMGQSPAGSSYNEEGEGLIFFQGRTDFGFRFPQVRLFTTEPKRMANKFDVLVSVRAPVGDINVAFERCCIGRGLSAVGSKYKSYCLYKLKSYRKFFDVFETEGTVFGSLNKQNFNDLESVIPNAEIVESFDSTILPLDNKVFLNERQIQALTQARDVLLPQLMSGKLRITES